MSRVPAFQSRTAAASRGAAEHAAERFPQPVSVDDMIRGVGRWFVKHREANNAQTIISVEPAAPECA